MRKNVKLNELAADKVAVSLLKTEIKNIQRENDKLRKSISVASPVRT